MTSVLKTRPAPTISEALEKLSNPDARVSSRPLEFYHPGRNMLPHRIRSSLPILAPINRRQPGEIEWPATPDQRAGVATDESGSGGAQAT